MTTVLFVRGNENERTKTDEQIHEPFDCGPGAHNQVNNIEVAAHELAKTNETPVEAADDDESERERV